MGIGSRIQQLRINNGLTQEKLAEMLNVSRQSVSKWEMEQSLPEVDKIVLMSKLFGVGTNEILSVRYILSREILKSPLLFMRSCFQ